MSGISIGVDVGGTKVAAGVVTKDGVILEHVTEPAPTASAADLVTLIVELVTRLRRTHEVESIGIGLPGLVTAAGDVIRFTPNLPLRDEPLADEVAVGVGLPVMLENDANSAAWAEARFGAGRGEAHLAMVTVGTGIGGGLVLDGQLYRGANGMAAEFGHLTLDPSGPLCGCGKFGCWEAVGSGRALVEAARRNAATDPAQARRLLAAAGDDLDAIDGPLVTTAARHGDPAAVMAFHEVGGWLGRGIAAVAAMLDVNLCVVGGGVAEAGDLLLAPAINSLAANLMAGGHRIPPGVVAARLGQSAGIIGAADLARERVRQLT